MLYYNLFYKWSFQGAEPSAAILHPAGFDATRLRGGVPAADHLGNVMIDPDLHFWGLEPETCGKVCRNLSTHDWMDLDLPRAEDFPGKKDEWQAAIDRMLPDAWPPVSPTNDDELKALIERCLDWQLVNGASAVILPTPTIEDDDVGLDEFVRWAKVGIQAAESIDCVALLSVSILDLALPRHYERLVDLVTSLPDVPGLYVAVITSRDEGIVPDSREFARALLEISHVVGHQHGLPVVINFADVFGLACVAVGAEGFGFGYERKCRGLSRAAYQDSGDGGGAYPRFFSLGTAASYLPARDLDRVRDERLLWMLDQDETQASLPLLGALRAGSSGNDAPAWREGRNNVAAARAHLIQRLELANSELLAMTDIRERAQWALRWLQNAERDANYLRARFVDDPLQSMGTHVGPWRAAYEQFVVDYRLV